MARNRSRSPLRGAGHRPPALQEAAVDRRRPSVASPASTDPSRRRRRNEIAKKNKQTKQKQTNTAHTFARLLPEFSVSFRSRNSRPHRASQVSGHRERFYDRKLSLAPAWQKKETKLNLVLFSYRGFDTLTGWLPLDVDSALSFKMKPVKRSAIAKNVWTPSQDGIWAWI